MCTWTMCQDPVAYHRKVGLGARVHPRSQDVGPLPVIWTAEVSTPERQHATVMLQRNITNQRSTSQKKYMSR